MDRLYNNLQQFFIIITYTGQWSRSKFSSSSTVKLHPLMIDHGPDPSTLDFYVLSLRDRKQTTHLEKAAKGGGRLANPPLVMGLTRQSIKENIVTTKYTESTPHTHKSFCKWRLLSGSKNAPHNTLDNSLRLITTVNASHCAKDLTIASTYMYIVDLATCIYMYVPKASNLFSIYKQVWM